MYRCGIGDGAFPYTLHPKPYTLVLSAFPALLADVGHVAAVHGYLFPAPPAYLGHMRSVLRYFCAAAAAYLSHMGPVLRDLCPALAAGVCVAIRVSMPSAALAA